MNQVNNKIILYGAHIACMWHVCVSEQTFTAVQLPLNLVHATHLVEFYNWLLLTHDARMYHLYSLKMTL